MGACTNAKGGSRIPSGMSGRSDSIEGREEELIPARSYGNEVRQFHTTGIPPTEDLNSEAYSLGTFPAPIGGSLAPKYGSGSGLIPREGQRVPASLGGGNAMGFGEGEGGRYLSQLWEGGTICDKTGMPRSIEVQVRALSLPLLIPS